MRYTVTANDARQKKRKKEMETAEEQKWAKANGIGRATAKEDEVRRMREYVHFNVGRCYYDERKSVCRGREKELYFIIVIIAI